MNVTPVRSVRTPRYPTAEQVKASPGMLQPRADTVAKRMTLSVALGSAISLYATGCAGSPVAALPRTQSGSHQAAVASQVGVGVAVPGIPMTACEPNMQRLRLASTDGSTTHDLAIDLAAAMTARPLVCGGPAPVANRHLQEAEAVRLIRSVMMVFGVEVRIADGPVCGLTVDLVDPCGHYAADWRDTLPDDRDLATALMSGQRYLYLPPTPNNAEPAEGVVGPVLAVFDSTDRTTLHQQVIDFILWLESQH
ncbi:MAG: hypothetical protein AB7K09_08290 [Planctomycetota bacterium]